jgi:hypothetical protein
VRWRQTASPTLQAKASRLPPPPPPVRRPAAVQARPAAPVPAGGAPRPAGVVQCLREVYKLSRELSASDFYQRIRAFERRQGFPPLELDKIFSYHRLMIWGTSFSGLVDPDEDQHLALLYHDIQKLDPQLRNQFRVEDEQQEAWERRSREGLHWRRERRRDGRPSTGRVYDLALIGRGTAIAAYLRTLSPTHDHFNTLLIGTPDPWGPQRGRGIDNINHTWQAIRHFGDQVPAYGTAYVTRDDFVQHNREVIEQAGIPETNVCAEAVVRITPGDGVFEIRTDRGGTPFRARKVVVGSGAGPHIEPEIVEREDQHAGRKVLVRNAGARARILDLDTFMRRIVSLPRGHVVISGGNAGIDAVNAARGHGWTVTWLAARPVHLPGAQNPHALRERTYDATMIAIDLTGGGRLSVSFTADRANHTVTADYYVYAIGQNPMADGAVGTVLGDLARGLEAMPSEGRFNEGRAVPGLRLAGTTRRTGLEVIGAAALSLVGRNAPETVGHLTGNRTAEGMAAVANDLPADVVTGDQIGTIRSAMAAANSFVPRYVTRDVDFSTDDRTTLAVYIAINFPYIQSTPSLTPGPLRTGVDDVIDDIIRWRGRPGRPMGHHPYGYDGWWRSHWLRVLREKNARGHGYWMEDQRRR